MYETTLELLARITQQILTSSNRFSGLYQGKAGELLFLVTLSQHFPEVVDEEHLQSVFTDVIDSSQRLVTDLSFSNGITGVAYLIECLATHQPELSELNDSYDVLLESALLDNFPIDEFELTRGLAGLLVYLMARSDQRRSKQAIEIIVERLEGDAVWSTNTCAWPTHNRSVFKLQSLSSKPEYNLGFAHGVPGLIAALLPLVNDTVVGERVKRLVYSSCDWLIEQRQHAAHFGSFYPDIVNSRARSRLGWCYGDLPIALLLGRVATLCDCPAYYALGEEIAIFSAQRRDEQSLVKNPALCHGSAGVSIIFQLLSNIYPQQELKVAADYWFDFTLRHPQVVTLLDGNVTSELLSNGLVNGYAGIGLAAISKLSQQTSWVGVLGLESHINNVVR